MALWLVRLRPARLAMIKEGPTAAEEDAVGRHFQYLLDLTARGIVHLAGRTRGEAEHTVGLCLLSAPDEPAARRIMEQDPAVAAGVMVARLDAFGLAILDAQGLEKAKGE